MRSSPRTETPTAATRGRFPLWLYDSCMELLVIAFLIFCAFIALAPPALSQAVLAATWALLAAALMIPVWRWAFV